MLSDQTPFTLEETLESLRLAVEEYMFRHAYWFSTSGDHYEELYENGMAELGKAQIKKDVSGLYSYVYEKKCNLNHQEMFGFAPGEYPYIFEPYPLTGCVLQSLGFWMTFLSNDVLGTIHNEEFAKPLNTLVTDGILRFRIDFAIRAPLLAHNLPSPVRPKKTINPNNARSTFSYGELAHIMGANHSTLRNIIRGATSYNPGLTPVKSKDGKKFKPETSVYPPELSNFFEGKVGGGAKVVIDHQEVVPYLAVFSSYQPTLFLPPDEEPFPDYSDSSKIYDAVVVWMKRYKRVRVRDLMHFIGAHGFGRDNEFHLWKAMHSGDAKLSLCTLAAINQYMIEVENRVNPENPWYPLLNAYEMV